MRTRNSKLINFILESSQILLVFLGVFSALMCAAFSLELIFDRGLCTLIMLLAAVLFYGLFTVLETFRNGKLYGILGITLFFLAIGIRFFSVVRKGFVTIVNAFLKEFMNYSGAKLTLLSYTDTESASVRFCTTLMLLLIGVYLIAIISAFFYRRRRSMVFLALTVPFIVVPMVVGKLGYFSNLFTYLVVAVVVVGTRHLRTDATDRRMRQKLSLILIIAGLVSGVLSYAFMPPERYERGQGKLIQTKNTIEALATWSAEDVFSWFKAYFNEDAIDYGKLGNKNEVTYNGDALLKISGSVNTGHGMYLKGYVGDIYEDNKWTSLKKNNEYNTALQTLEERGATPESWHVRLRNELGDNETSGAKDLWNIGKLRIRNLGFGYGNYLIPYLPAGAFKYENNGHSTIDNLGVDYTVEYYNIYPVVLRRDVLNNNYSLANLSFWEDTRTERQQLTDFVKKYYLQVPENLKTVTDEFADYLEQQNDLLNRYEQGTANESDMIRAVKNYIMKDTTYTLAPGRTPSDRDTVEYFLRENKKGYCTYYATSAVILLRSVGIPARYVEGMYVPKDVMEKYKEGEEISVLDKNAHAWVEVYSENYGFVPLEVTPGIGEDEAEESDVINDELDQGQTANPSDSKDGEDDKTEEVPEEVTPTPSVTETPEESMTFDDIDGNEDEPEEMEDGGTSEAMPQSLMIALQILLVILFVVAVLEAQRRIRRMIFNRNLKGYRMKKKIRMVYHHLALAFFQKGAFYRGQPMAVFAAELTKTLHMPEGDMIKFVDLIYHARFGPDDITEAQLSEFRVIYENIRKKLYADAKIMRKLYYMYIMVL
ncbi:MAG: hypothetical protein J1F22_07580 [Lachnospiraceae bacterium]|nr:hypothetical protein [Lachnospiraceae bacterium]